jgi:hypothetical protein
MSDILGFSTEPASTGDFLPYIKYNSVAGQLQLIERTQGADGFANETLILKRDAFRAVFDLENLETGWLDFSSPVPQSLLIKLKDLFHSERNPNGILMPPNPVPDSGWKQGTRFLLKLPKQVQVEASESGVVGAYTVERQIREMASNAKAFNGGIGQLYRDYLAEAAAHPGMLPVVAIEAVVLQKTGPAGKQSAAFRPKFKIMNWASRPADLIWKPRPGATGAMANGGNAANRPQQTARPSTGSRPAAPPVARETLADDFG